MTTSPAHTGRKHNGPKLLYVHIPSVCHSLSQTHTHTLPCTQDKSDRQRLNAKVRPFPFHSSIQRVEIIHYVQVDLPKRELTLQPATERVRLCEWETDRQTDRASLCILTAPALGQPVHVSEGPLNNELSLPRHWHWLLSSPLLLLSCTSSAPSLSPFFLCTPSLLFY